MTEQPLEVSEGNICLLAFSHDCRTLAAGYHAPEKGGGGVVAWDLAARRRSIERPSAMSKEELTGEELGSDPLSRGVLSAIAFSLNDRAVAVAWGKPGREKVMSPPLTSGGTSRPSNRVAGSSSGTWRPAGA